MRFAIIILAVLIPVFSYGATRAELDARSVALYRDGLGGTIAEMKSIDVNTRMLNAVEKEKARKAWGSFLDYILALDSIGSYHRHQNSAASVAVTYSAFLAQYRRALEMINAAEKLPGADEILNERMIEMGLDRGSYARVKFRFLNIARATEFASLDSLHRIKGGSPIPELRRFIDEDSTFIVHAGHGKAQLQTAANALKIATTAAFTAWFPVQKGVAAWMGDTRVARGHQFLITEKQIAAMESRIEPGDVLLERREWYVSNVGLPGFWPHTAMFIGDAASRRAYFNNDDQVRDWVRQQGRADGDFESFLRQRYASVYPESRKGRVIEAMSEGVVFTTLEHSAAADTLAVIRPRASKRDKAVAIARAFGYIGRPYDFNFDFHTDTSLVCSEVVYKAYEGSVTLPLSTTLNRPITAPNEIVREFDATYGTPSQQFDFVLFLDGHELKRAAIPGSLEGFRESWRRPKWHTVTQ